MRELFDVAELVRIGIEDESSGVVFYQQLAQQTTNPQLKVVYDGLCEQERYHKKRFEQMLETLGNYQPHEQYPGEYMTYLRTLTGGRAFPDEPTATRLARECKTDVEAIDLASQFERDTLILMNEMRGLLPESDQVIVNELIREEQSHLVALANARHLAK